jgi:hypothetical protein
MSGGTGHQQVDKFYEINTKHYNESNNFFAKSGDIFIPSYARRGSCSDTD